MANPVLIEVTRGPLVESRHRGAVAIVRADGSLALALGDVTRPVYPRSAIKPLQALPLIESGAAEAFGFGREEIALASASHSGAPRHVAVARRMLEWAGLRPDDLGCGAHAPADAESAAALVRQGETPGALHNNCSGKHAGMLATAAHLGEPLGGYWRPEHAVQVRIEQTLEQMTGLTLGAKVRGIDGCSVPTWAMPLTALARAYARLATGVGLAPERAAACRAVREACIAEPELVAGRGRICTQLMQAARGAALVKTGAEGVYCAGLPEAGLGIALKIDDGAGRAAEGAIAHVLARLVRGQDAAFAALATVTLRNWKGVEVGSQRASFELTEALSTL